MSIQCSKCLLYLNDHIWYKTWNMFWTVLIDRSFSDLFCTLMPSSTAKMCTYGVLIIFQRSSIPIHNSFLKIFTIVMLIFAIVPERSAILNKSIFLIFKYKHYAIQWLHRAFHTAYFKFHLLNRNVPFSFSSCPWKLPLFFWPICFWLFCIPHKWHHVVFVLLWLAISFRFRLSEVHTYCHIWQISLF